ncbi:hypothetical protein F5888DRAFT_1797051 [Russula emetica]|nr:hypothetical protein F5888DRAFT_1797051 [Russula emetica]
MSVALQHVPTLNGLNGASTESKRAKSRKSTQTPKGQAKESYYTVDLKGAAPEAFSDVFARFQFEVRRTAQFRDEAEKKPLSKKKQRKLNRLTVAELKQLVASLKSWNGRTFSAADPRLLLHLKCYRNTIPIPAHWSAKRDYLQGKRGIEKPPFQLPSYIADTGIATQRDAIKEKEANMSLKAKTRERVQPKMGKIDIDYQKLHDAFFKFQTKPPLTSFGEMYYEGKEFETSLKKNGLAIFRQSSSRLFLFHHLPRRHGSLVCSAWSPTKYPTLRIPGLNAPIPEGCRTVGLSSRWMGKPPLDEYNRPLYGDVFGVLPKTNDTAMGEPVDKNLWGELEPEEDEEEEESDEEDEEEEEEATDAAPADGLQTPSGLATPSGMASVVSTVAAGLETPDFLELRKTSTAPVRDEGGNRQLYSVLPEKQTVLGEERGNKRKAGGVDVSLDASELEGLSEEELRKRYDAQERGSAGVPGQGPAREDFSDMVAKEMAKKRQKMEADRDRDRGKRDKGGRDFKF